MPGLAGKAVEGRRSRERVGSGPGASLSSSCVRSGGRHGPTHAGQHRTTLCANSLVNAGHSTDRRVCTQWGVVDVTMLS